MPVSAVIDNEESRLQRLISWSKERISEHQFVLILAFVIGLLTAIAAYSLHWIINQIELLLTSSFASNTYNWLYLV